MAELATAPELDMELVAVSTDYLQGPGGSQGLEGEERARGARPGIMVGDRTSPFKYLV